MKTIGIKLADGSFYPVIKEGSSEEVVLNLTTANNNQTKIMVDLYRSKTDSMDDAEYVDSLQIDNLVEHPNGEPDISFTVSLDENNQLTAKIVDPETGAQSNSTITLVSRTQEQRLVTDEYNIAETQEDFEEEAPAEKSLEDKEAEEAAAVASMVAEAVNIPDEEIVTEEEPVFEETAVEESAVEEPVTEESAVEETVSEEIPVEETVEESPSVASQFVEDDLTAFGGEASHDEQKESLENFFDTVPESSELPTMDGTAFDMPDETFDETEMPDMSDMTFDVPEETDTADTFEMPSEESTELPDMDDTAFQMPEETDAAGTESFDIPQESSGLDSFEIPEETADTFEMPSEESPETDDFNITEETTGFGDMDMDLNMDLDDSSFDMPQESFPEDEASSDDFAPMGGGISFTGLYDKETELGSSSSDGSGKSKAPLIICIIILILLLIGGALLLFVLPTKFNILNKKDKTEQKIEAPAEPVVAKAPAPVPEPEPIPSAKEDEVIIIEKAEEVVPLPPPVAEEKPKDIIYKIKWGDTLWDISDTYYKNPWRYKYIARFNGIPDPDYIVSGTFITIPAE